ncbi:hypothetical protein STA3757_41110 [Stanieria sp. NIES-3757]|nr:hypothetical protein STA3757_41110 [Stanieria sp. NIES-3757]
MNRLFVAIYIDLENIPCSKFQLKALIKQLELESNEGNYSAIKPVFSIKRAYGLLDSVNTDFKKQLSELGFYMIHTIRIGEKKNRADLFISIDAFESLYLNNPNINRYIFLTSDSDFTVIGEKLRTYGKDVWLVCRKQDRERAILSNAFDKLLYLEDYYESEQNSLQKRDKSDEQENDELAKKAFIEVLKTIDPDKLPCNISVIHDRMKLSDPGLDMRNTSFKSFKTLVNFFEGQKMIETQPGEANKPWLLVAIPREEII